jgi:MIF4G like
VDFRLPDLSLPVQHPRRAFMRRAVEFEIRLSYHDRIMKTLPESMQSSDAYIISEQAPGPAYEYDDISQFSLSLLLHSKILKYAKVIPIMMLPKLFSISSVAGLPLTQLSFISSL